MPLDNLINSSASPRQGWSGHSRAVQLPAGMCLLIGRKPPVRAHYQPGGTVTDVIEGTAGAEGQNTGHTSGEGIPADPARNNGNSSLGWALDDLLTEEPGPAPQASAPVAHESWWDAPHRSASRTDLRPAALAKKIASITPGGMLSKSFFTNSGTEANETAILTARCYTGSDQIVALRHSYHGRSAMAMTLTGQGPWRLGPSQAGVVHAHNAYCYRCPFGLT